MSLQTLIDEYPSVVIPLFFVLLWCGNCFLISAIGGWWELAERFRFRGKFDGQTWHTQSGWMRVYSHYSHCLTVGANREGLYLAPLVLFRAAHPPLFIPWGEVRVSYRKVLFLDWTVLTLGGENQVPLRIGATLANRLREASGENWPRSAEPWSADEPKRGLGTV